MYEDPLESFNADNDIDGGTAAELEMPVRILIFNGSCTDGCAGDELGTLSVSLNRSLGILIFRPVLCGDIFLSDELTTVDDASVLKFNLSLGTF